MAGAEDARARAADDTERAPAQRVADAVLAIPGVSGLHGGLFGEVATYLPGGRVSGVALDDNGGSVHVVLDLSRDLLGVADLVRDTATEVAGVPMSVTVEDVTTGGRESGDAAATPARTDQRTTKVENDG
ncbi:hypothetical protein GCM10009624_12930 [Gordonia sinesedis]